MQAPGDKEPTPIVLDASSVIDLIELGLLEVVLASPGLRFGIPGEVVAEIRRESEKAALESAIQRSGLEPLVIDDPGEMALKEEIRARLAEGEAACLAIAATRGWVLACEERNPRFEREVTLRLGSSCVTRVEDLLVAVVRAGLKTQDQIEAIVDGVAEQCASAGDARKAAHLQRVIDRFRMLLRGD